MAPPSTLPLREESRSELARALAVVLRRRFDEGHAVGPKSEFGQLLREREAPITDASASVKTSKLLGGQLPWPELQWREVAEFVGLEPAELLEEVAAELRRLEEEG